MEHEYYASRRRDDRRAWVPLVAVLVLLAAAFGAVLLAFRDDGAAEPAGSLPSLALRPTTTSSTTTSTTAAPPTLPSVTAPPVVQPPVGGSAAPDRSLPEGLDVGEPRPALSQLADDLDASDVTDIVPIGADRFAMLVRSGAAELYRWTGSEWERERIVSAPAAVSDIATGDLTGDGTADFRITLAGPRAPGGVFARTTFGFDLLPFNTNAGQEQWLDDLHVNVGRLISDVTDRGNRISVQWTWTGRQFEVLG